MLKFLGGLILLVVLSVGGAFFYVDTIVKAGIEKGGTYALGVPTRVGSVRPGLVDGRFGLDSLTVANPSGFDGDNFFELGSIDVEVTLPSLMEDIVRVPLLSLDGIAVDIEKNARGTNYGAILDSLGRFEGGGDEEEAAEGGKQFVIEKLSITNVKADLSLDFAGKESELLVEVPQILLTDVGSDGGVNMGELTALITKAVLEAVMESGGLPSALLSDLQGRLGDLGSVDIELPEGAGRAVAAYNEGDKVGAATEALDSIDDDRAKQASDVVKGLGGLLGSKKSGE